jgi:predicted dehydrogenase
MIGVGVIGAGYWGPKHIRNFGALPGARVAMVADLSEARLAPIRAQYRGVQTTTDHRHLLRARDVDAVVIATSVTTHARLAREALLAGKHVLVEKPLAASSAQCKDLIRLAAEHGRVLMVGHTFLYNPAVLVLRELVRSGEIGDVRYAYAQRLNLGLFQRDVHVLWDLAPHDVSILMYVLGTDPIAVAARGGAHVQAGVPDVAFMDLAFPHNVSAAVHVSWLDPNKVRRITLVGSKKMIVYDDVEPREKIRVYDRGIDVPPRPDRFGQLQLTYRDGDVYAPPVPDVEPLRLECEHFLDCIETGATPRTDGEQGLKVVRTLEMADVSLLHGGVMVSVATSGGAGEVAPGRNGAAANGAVLSGAAQNGFGGGHAVGESRRLELVHQEGSYAAG